MSDNTGGVTACHTEIPHNNSDSDGLSYLFVVWIDRPGDESMVNFLHGRYGTNLRLALEAIHKNEIGIKHVSRRRNRRYST